MEKPTDDRSAIAVALAWSTRITAVALEMVIPAVIGYWLDERLGTVMVFVVLGAILGMASSLTHLLRMDSPPKTGISADGGRQDRSQ